MRMKTLIPFAALVMLLIVPAAADAQGAKPWKDWYGHIAGGYAGVQGDLADAFNSGWNISGGATYKPEPWPVGIMVDLGYNDFGMSQEARDFFESSGGDGAIWSLTTDLVWAPKLNGSVGFNISGGVGVYNVEARLKEPTYVCGPVCPPYSWWCWWGCTPGNVITDSRSSTEFGYNIGAAINFTLNNDSQIYIEAKYHRIETDIVTEYFPVLIGYRW